MSINITDKIGRSKPKTLEELFVENYTELQKNSAEVLLQFLMEKGKNANLQKLVDTWKKHATLDNGTVCIFLTESKKEDRDFIVKALELKEEEKPNE